VSFDHASVAAKWHLNPSNGLSWVHELLLLLKSAVNRQLREHGTMYVNNKKNAMSDKKLKVVCLVEKNVFSDSLPLANL